MAPFLRHQDDVPSTLSVVSVVSVMSVMNVMSVSSVLKLLMASPVSPAGISPFIALSVDLEFVVLTLFSVVVCCKVEKTLPSTTSSKDHHF